MKPKALNTQIYSEASDWLIEFRSGDVDAQGRKDFYQWLKTSPEHMRAYLELAAIWNEGSSLDADRIFDGARLARDLESEINIARLPTLRKSGESEERASRDGYTAERQPSLASATHHWGKKARIVTLAAGFLLVSLSLTFWYEYVHNTYGTGVGEERMFTLSDGSSIELNSDSRIRLRFSQKTRGVELLRGQALFHVAKDPARPFIVRTDQIQIRAVGTQFDVYRNRASTTVTVVEGTVAVLPESKSPPVEIGSASGNQAVPSSPVLAVSRGPGELLLTAGEQVTVAPAAAPKPVRADVAAATAWTQHELIFKGASLEEVAAEFNRYNQRHLIIHGSDIANLRVTGIFSSTDSSSLIRFLQARPDISVTESGDEILVSYKP